MSARMLITEHLDLWTGTVTKKYSSGRGSNGKAELTGIKKLRELILELAIHGKLVEQMSSDEPARKLLEKIENTKKLSDKKGKKLPPLQNDEKPYHLPDGWEVTRYGEIVAVTTGKLDANAADEGGRYPFFTCSRSPSAINTYAFDCEAILLAGNGDFNLKYYSGKFNAYQRTYVIEPIQVDLKFLYYLTVSQIERITENNRGSAIPYLKLNDILMPFVYLPPLEEQHRIVQKVDELMALCDRLEQQTSDQIEAHETLVDTLLGTLTQSENATELADNWSRIAAHFDTLFTTEQSIDKLKQTILQLAVMGRLVEQDAGDEPVSALLPHETTKKRQSSDAGKTNALSKSSNISSSDKPFPIPSSWAWVQFENLTTLVTSGSRGWKEYFAQSGALFIRSQDIKTDRLKLENPVYVDLPEPTEGMRTRVLTGDLLMTITGANVAKAALVEQPVGEAFVSQHVGLVRPANTSLGPYLHVWLTGSHGGRGLLLSSSYGAKPGLNLKNIKELPIPLPPLAEQRRIVQKVDELMTLCDKLKERLNQAGETRCQLAETVVDNALH